jgi:hypothetical protein
LTSGLSFSPVAASLLPRSSVTYFYVRAFLARSRSLPQ